MNIFFIRSDTSIFSLLSHPTKLCHIHTKDCRPTRARSWLFSFSFILKIYILKSTSCSHLCLTRSCRVVLTLTTLNFVCKPWKPKGIFPFEIIINVLVSSFCFIWIPMLWVCGHYEYFKSFSAGIVFRRQNLTSVDVRFWRLKTVPELKGLNKTVKIKQLFLTITNIVLETTEHQKNNEHWIENISEKEKKTLMEFHC